MTYTFSVKDDEYISEVLLQDSITVTSEMISFSSKCHLESRKDSFGKFQVMEIWIY
jgi:hypothetical protein